MLTNRVHVNVNNDASIWQSESGHQRTDVVHVTEGMRSMREWDLREHVVHTSIW